MATNQSPEYKIVLVNLQHITNTLRTNKAAANSLCLKMKEQTWIEVVADPSPNELMKVVLDRIENDRSQFNVFKRFLDDIPGLDLISTKLVVENAGSYMSFESLLQLDESTVYSFRSQCVYNTRKQ